MVTTSTTRTDDETDQSTGGAEESTDPSDASPLLPTGRYARLSMVAGGAILLRALFGRSRTRLRAIAKATLGMGLILLGLRRRASAADSPLVMAGPGNGDPPATGSDDHSTGISTPERRAESHDPDRNPRDVGASAAETDHDGDEGGLEFSTDDDGDPEQEPHLDQSDPKDPRFPDEDDPSLNDDPVDVDISETAVADEPNEAAGPSAEQAYPTTEATDPEPTAPAAPEREADGSDEEEPSEKDADDPESSTDDER